MEMQIEFYLICVFFVLFSWLLVWWLTIITIASYSRNIIIEKWPDFSLSLSPSDSLAPAFYQLDGILDFHIGYDASATRHWIEFRNRLNTIRHRYICIVATESLRWIKHKWARDCHKNQSLETTHTHARKHTVFAWRNFFAALDIWLLFYQFDHLHILSIFVNLEIAKEKSVYSLSYVCILSYAGAKRSQRLVWYWCWQRGTTENERREKSNNNQSTWMSRGWCYAWFFEYIKNEICVFWPNHHYQTQIQVAQSNNSHKKMKFASEMNIYELCQAVLFYFLLHFVSFSLPIDVHFFLLVVEML